MMRFPLTGAPFVVLFFAISVHAYDPSLLVDNQKFVEEAEVTPLPPPPNLAPAGPQDDNRLDAILEGGGAEALGALLEEGQQRPKLRSRGKGSLGLGLGVVLALLLYGALSSAETRVANGVVDILKSPTESLATKARVIRSRLLHPAPTHPQSNLILIAYAAAWALFVSGLLEVVRTRRFISRKKAVEKMSATTPDLPPDVRVRNLGVAGALLAVLSAAGLLLNIHPSLFYFFYVGLGIMVAGAMVMIAKMLEKADIKDIFFPERKNPKP